MKYFFQLQEEEIEAGSRLDKCISDLIEELSRTAAQTLIQSQKVIVNGRTEKVSYKIKGDENLEVDVPDPVVVEILPQDIPLDILYEDKDLLIVNKPKGMVVHPAPGHYTDTLVNAVMYHCKEDLSGINGEIRPGIVHRIDKDTTGALIICKNDQAHRKIAEQIKEHSVTRRYVGIVCGNVKADEETIDAPIGRHRTDRKKMGIDSKGRNAVTHYKVLKRFQKFTYMQFQLETGRTHQIRVHMSSKGHPLLGDQTYGYVPTNSEKKWNLEGQCLHAESIGFIHPTTGTYMEFHAPIPKYFLELLDNFSAFS